MWQDNWIPRSGCPRPLGRKTDTSVQKVSDLFLLGTKEWNVDLIKEFFYETDAVDILQLVVGNWEGDDYLAWNWTADGVFSVKSAYRIKRYDQFIKHRDSKGGSSSSVANHNGWLKLWSCNAPGKVKIHAWRLALHSIAVGVELARRKIKFNVRCPFCYRDESFAHCFWSCGYVTEAWMELQNIRSKEWPRLNENSREADDVLNWLLNIFSVLREDDLGLFITMLYEVWQTRNAVSHGEPMHNPKEISRRVNVLTDEWRQLNPSFHAPSPRVAARWCPPPQGWSKINVDGGLDTKLGVGGAGVLIRQPDGVFTAGKCSRLPGVHDPLLAELLAAKEGLLLANQQGLQKVMLEMDCSEAVRKLKNAELDRSLYGPLIQEIKVRASLFPEFCVALCRRDANECAHVLADWLPFC